MTVFEIIGAPFQFDFMRTSIEVALILSLLCGSLGVLLVPRGLSMLGDGLAHATFGGIGLGLLLGFMVDDAIWFAMPFAVLVAVGIVWLGRHVKIAGDAALGVFFAVSLAIGIASLHIASKSGLGIDIESVLFGNILGVQSEEMIWIRCMGVFIFGTLAVLGPRIAYAGFYGELAEMSGIRVVLKEYILMALTAAVTVLAVKAVGVMLVSAWLVIPATIGRHMSKTSGTMFFYSIGTGKLGSVIGLLAAYYFDIPGGASMTLALGFLFLLSLIVRGLIKL